MSLSDFASLAGAISGFAVLASLAFLYLQSKIMIRNQQSLVHLQRTQGLNDFMTMLSEPAMTDIAMRGFRGDTTFSAAEHFRFANTMWSLIVSYENSFLQYRAGLLSKEQFQASLGPLKWNCLMPGFRAFWVSSRPLFEQHFAEFMDAQMSKNPAVANPSGDSFEGWKREASRQLAAAQSGLRNIRFD